MKTDATYHPLYRRIGYGTTADGQDVTFEVECHAFEGWDGRQVGVIRWLVRSRAYEREVDSGECAVIERGAGYFWSSVERAVSLYQELNAAYNRCEAEIAEEVLHG